MAAPGTLLSSLLDSVSPVSNGPEGRVVSPDLPADAGRASPQRFYDTPHTFSPFPANDDFLPLGKGEMGIAFFLKRTHRVLACTPGNFFSSMGRVFLLLHILHRESRELNRIFPMSVYPR
jgi:hypothetical protein